MRLLDVVIDPLDAFRDIRTAAPWALAIAVAIVLRFVSLLVFYAPALTPLKIMASLAFQVASVVPPLVLGALVTWVAAKPWRLGVAWRHVFSVCAHVYVAYTVATILFASVAGAVLPDFAAIDLRHPPFTSLTFLVDRSTSSALVYRLAGEADVRVLYAAVLLWIGLRAASYPDPQRNTGRTAACVVATVAVIRIVAIAAMAVAAS